MSLTDQLGMNSESEQIEVTKKELKEKVQFGESIKRLLKSPDFNKVIMEGFLNEEIVRCVKNKTNPAMQTQALQNGIEHNLMGASALNSWLSQQMQLASIAESTLEQEKQRDLEEDNA